jgi:anti-anti-sigma factor
MDVKLVAVEGEWRDSVFPIEGPEFVIGRAATCQLQLDHSLVDLEHCRIRRDGDNFILEDLGSTFGTSLNGRRIQRSELRDGDRLRVGPTTFLISLTGQVAPGQTAPAPPTERPTDRPRGRAPGDDTPAVETARQVFERLMSRKAEAAAPAEPDEPADMPQKTTRLQFVKEEEGIALVNIVDRSIIHDAEIQQIGRELDEMIQQGHRRIVLDFGNVKHMSSQAVGVLLQAQKRCKSGGGLLKLCNPLPSVAEVFKITNLPRAIEIHPDEEKALRTGWPEPPPPPKPAPAPSAAAPDSDEPSTDELPIQLPPKLPPTLSTGSSSTRVTGQVRLVLEVGKSKGKALKITGPEFVIGRDPKCQLRPASTAVSRTHTRITIREGHVYVRDLGTTNGTLLAHRLLRGTEAEAHNGDLLQIGPLLFRIVWDKSEAAAAPEPTEDATASWLLQGTSNAGLSDTALYPLPTNELIEEARKRALAEVKHIRYQVHGPTVVVTILTADLRDETQIAPIRHELMTLMEQPVPKNVVLRIDRVTFLSSSAIGMLLAHHQRLARVGGGLRFAMVRPEVRPVLETQRVSMLVEIFDSVEDAIREPWPISDAGP